MSFPIIGHTEFGKRNVRRFYTFCPTCHRFTRLKEYQTTRCLSFLKIPLFPSDQIRVSECPLCGMRHGQAYEEWKLAKNNALQEAGALFKADPADIATVIELLSVLHVYRERSFFLAVEKKLAASFPQSAAFQELLGDTYLLFGLLPPAEKAYLTALTSPEPTPIPLNFYLLYILQQQPDQVMPYLLPVLKEKDPAKLGLLLLAAESYQSLGLHQEALSLLEQTAAAFPFLKEQSVFKRLFKLSQSKLQSRSKVLSRYLKALLTRKNILPLNS